jgi:hypothetical protein
MSEAPLQKYSSKKSWFSLLLNSLKIASIATDATSLAKLKKWMIKFAYIAKLLL